MAPDAMVASGETVEAVSVSSATPELQKKPRCPALNMLLTVIPKWAAGDGAAVNEAEGESLSDPSSSPVPKASESPATVQDHECAALPCEVDNNALLTVAPCAGSDWRASPPL